MGDECSALPVELAARNVPRGTIFSNVWCPRQLAYRQAGNWIRISPLGRACSPPTFALGRSRTYVRGLGRPRSTRLPCPHHELNMDPGLRSPLFYPLNYGGPDGGQVSVVRQSRIRLTLIHLKDNVAEATGAQQVLKSLILFLSKDQIFETNTLTNWLIIGEKGIHYRFSEIYLTYCQYI